jgi:hypothetical protein
MDDTDGDEYWGYDLKGMMLNAAEQAEEFAIAMWHKLQSWKVIHFSHLPQWLQDNDFLHFGHRPPLPTSECFKSIIRIHTETGNIWTHLLGVMAFLGLATFFMIRPSTEIQLQVQLLNNHIAGNSKTQQNSMDSSLDVYLKIAGYGWEVTEHLPSIISGKIGIFLFFRRSYCLHGIVISLSYSVL